MKTTLISRTGCQKFVYFRDAKPTEKWCKVLPEPAQTRWTLRRVEPASREWLSGPPKRGLFSSDFFSGQQAHHITTSSKGRAGQVETVRKASLDFECGRKGARGFLRLTPAENREPETELKPGRNAEKSFWEKV